MNINSAGLTLSGTLPEGYVIVINANVTLDGATLGCDLEVACAEITIKGNVTVNGYLGIGGEGDTPETRIYGVSGGTLTVNRANAIGVYNQTVFENITLVINSPEEIYVSSAISGGGAVSFINSAVTVGSGLINVKITLNASTLTFGNGAGFEIFAFEEAPVIILTNNSKVEFEGKILGAFIVSVDTEEDVYINNDGYDEETFSTVYTTYDTFEAWYASLGEYTWLLSKDSTSTFE